jgi:hypothetical protein
VTASYSRLTVSTAHPSIHRCEQAEGCGLHEPPRQPCGKTADLLNLSYDRALAAQKQ